MNSLFYREYGQGFPLLILHGGWGHDIYSFDVTIHRLQDRFRILIPDRSGYGQSGRTPAFPRGFHQRASGEMRTFLNDLGMEQCALWGHSDGAVTAAIMGIEEPERFPAIVAEAIHYDRCKKRSREFFETAAGNPRKFGAKIAAVLANEHGEDYWEQLLRTHGRAWLDILENCGDPAQDLYANRISSLTQPLLILHGSEDPRTEPGELQRLHEAVPHATLHVMAGAGHSPHSEPAFAAVTARLAEQFLLDRTSTPSRL